MIAEFHTSSGAAATLHYFLKHALSDGVTRLKFLRKL
jgi:hypothetical protein